MSPEQVEDDFDVQTMMMQEMARDIELSPRMPFGGSATMPLPEAGKVMVGKADETGWENVENPSDSVVYPDRATFEIAVAAGYSKADGFVLNVGGAMYVASSSSTHLVGLPGWREFGAYTPEHQGARPNDATFDDGVAFEHFFANIAGRNAEMKGEYTFSNRAKMAFVCNGGGFSLDRSGSIMNASTSGLSGTRRRMITLAGTPQTEKPITNISVSTDAFQVVTTTLEVADHGFVAGQDVFLSSDDVYDVGYDLVNETRGQRAKISSVVDTDSFTIDEPIHDDLTTNPVAKAVSYIEDVVITGGSMIGPGRRSAGASGGAEGDTGIALEWCRNVHIIGSYIRWFDYNGIRMDNCVGCTVSKWRGTLEQDNGTEAFSAHVVALNACDGCIIEDGMSWGGKHPVDWTRNSTPGIGRNSVIRNNIAHHAWYGFATHGNSVNCSFENNRSINCFLGVNVRAPGWTVEDHFGEHCAEVVRLTDNPVNCTVKGTIGHDVNYVVRLPSSDDLIGTPDVGNLTITNTVGVRVTGNTVNISPTMPHFTQVDSACQGGTTTTIVVGSLGAPFDANRALQGAEIDFDPDGPGSGVLVSRYITQHVWDGTTNTLTFAAVGTAPVAGLTTYTIYDTTKLLNLVIDGVNSQDCAFADVVVAGPWIKPVIRNVNASHETGVSQPVVLVQASKAELAASAIVLGGISQTGKNGPSLSAFVENVIWETPVTPFLYGATGGDKVKDTAGLQGALNTSAKEIYIPDATFFVEGSTLGTPALTSTVDDRFIHGPGVITADEQVSRLIDITGDRTRVRINVDGNNMIGDVLNFTAESPKADGCVIRNLNGSDNWSAIALRANLTGGIDTPVHFTNNIIENLQAVGNATPDGVGMTRAVLISGDANIISDIHISGNMISDVMGEEGDAITVISSNGAGTYYDCPAIIEGNHLNGWSRRAIKVQANKVAVRKNTFRNTQASAVGQLQRAVDFVQGGRQKCIGNTFIECRYQVQIGVFLDPAEAIDGVTVAGNFIEGVGAETASDLISIQTYGGDVMVTGNMVNCPDFTNSSIQIRQVTDPIVMGNRFNTASSNPITQASCTGDFKSDVGGLGSAIDGPGEFYYDIITGNHVLDVSNGTRQVVLKNRDASLSDGEVSGKIAFSQNDTSDPDSINAGIRAQARGSSGTLDLIFSAGFSETDVMRVKSTAVEPMSDNSINLGAATMRWGTIYAGTGTINTSDKKSKREIKKLTESEVLIGKRIPDLIRSFKMLDGESQHVGVIAQEVEALFESEGLNARDYGILSVDLVDGVEVYGVRYDELLAMAIAGMG